MVVETVGVKGLTGCFRRAMIDMFGTPYTEKLRLVERYRMVDYDEAKDGLDRGFKENWQPPGPMAAVDRNYRGRHLQIYVTIEDENVFTTPWSATLTYMRGTVPWPETVCAENRFEFGGQTHVPTAHKPDF